jgi:hypothetical protein
MNHGSLYIRGLMRKTCGTKGQHVQDVFGKMVQMGVRKRDDIKDFTGT